MRYSNRKFARLYKPSTLDPYNPLKRRTPYKSERDTPYKRVKPRPYNASSSQRSSGRRSSYRPIRHNFRSTKEKYSPIPKTKPSSERWIPPRKGPAYRIEFPQYESRPDTEALLKKLERDFDERLEEEMLERMDQDFSRFWNETLREHGIAAYEDEDVVRDKLLRRLDPAKWQEEHKDDFLEISEEDVDNAKNVELSREEEHADFISSEQEPGQQVSEVAEIPETDTDQAPEAVEHDIVTAFHNHETWPPPEEQPPDSAELLEFDLATDPLMQSDIETLIEEVEAEEEVEAVENGY